MARVRSDRGYFLVTFPSVAASLELSFEIKVFLVIQISVILDILLGFLFTYVFGNRAI